MMPRRFTAKAVGVTFVEGYPDNLLALEVGERVQLVRDPENKFDPNAVRIEARGKPIGHVARVTAKRLAADIDGGAKWAAAVAAIKTYEDNTGVEFLFERAD